MEKKYSRKKIILACIVLFFVAVIIILMFLRNGYRNAVSGIREPVQEPATGFSNFDLMGYDTTVLYKYTYDIEGLVVHTKDYISLKFDDTLSPRDFAIAWGNVAALNKDIDFHWSQTNRFAYCRVDSATDMGRIGGDKALDRQLSNNHIISANDDVKRKIWLVKRGDHIRMKGYLVTVTAKNDKGESFYWNSSTSRTDTGDGACEVIYVTDIEWL